MEVSGQLHAPASYPRVGDLGIQWIGGWGNSKAGLDAVTKNKCPIIAPAGNWTPVLYPSTFLYLYDIDSLC
jgi:hypothetical protein